jgi:hypothetical protein
MFWPIIVLLLGVVLVIYGVAAVSNAPVVTRQPVRPKSQAYAYTCIAGGAALILIGGAFATA